MDGSSKHQTRPDLPIDHGKNTDPARAEVSSMTNEGEPLLVLSDVRLVYPGEAGPVEVLKGVDLTIAAGEIVAVTGPSGSGKSSLLALAAGLEPASSGDIRLLGRSLRGLSEDDLARLRRGKVGVVFQAFHLMPNMTALENVALAAEIAGLVSGARARDLARQALDRVGLSARASHYPPQLSGGEQQRVAVARAIVGQPAIIFADEPTGNLDRQAGIRVRDLLFDVARETKAALLLVTHDPQLAASCEREIRIEDGVIQ